MLSSSKIKDNGLCVECIQNGNIFFLSPMALEQRRENKEINRREESQTEKPIE